MSYRAGDYLAVLPHNPIGVVMRALQALQPRVRQPGRHHQAGEQHHVAAGRLPGQRQRAAVPLRRAGPAGDARPGRRARRRDPLPAREGRARQAGRGGRLPARGARQAGQRARAARALRVLRARLRRLPRDAAAGARRASTRSRRRRSGTPTRCTLTVAIVDAPALSGQGRYQGMASSYLANCSAGRRASRSRCARRTTTSIRRRRPRRRW